MKIKILAAFVAGVMHRNADLTSVVEGTPLTFEPEPTNPHDPDAIIIRDPLGQNIGYVPRVSVAPIHDAINNGWEPTGRVVERGTTRHKEISFFAEVDLELAPASLENFLSEEETSVGED